MKHVILGAAAASILACARRAEPLPTPARDTGKTVSAPPPRPLSQWENPGQWVVLRDREGKAAALVSVASSPTEARPIVVSAHGSQSNPEWNCPHVRATFGPSPWIVCPHPNAHLGADASWQSAVQLAEAIDRSVTLLSEKVGDRADRRDVNFIGHSQGAVQGPLAIDALRNVHMRTITLFEGPPYHAGSVARLLAKAAPERVLLLSGSTWGLAATRELGAKLRAAGLDVHAHETGTGHFFVQRTYDEVHAELAWLVPKASPEASPAPKILAALDGASSEELFHDGKRVAIADIPQGTAEPRPVVFAAHAAGVGPEWICAAARNIFGPKPIVLCPDAAPSAGLVETVLAAAQLRFGPYLSAERSTYVGYSQGAMLAPIIWSATVQPLHFSAALLLEGLPTKWEGLPESMQHAGLERVFLVSGQGGWAPGHDAFAKALRARKVEAKHLSLRFGHVPTDEVVEQIRKESAWLRAE